MCGLPSNHNTLGSLWTNQTFPQLDTFSSNHMFYVLRMQLADCIPYLCLDHLHPLVPEVRDDGWEVHSVLTAGLLKGYVQGNEGPCASHTSTVR